MSSDPSTVIEHEIISVRNTIQSKIKSESSSSSSRKSSSSSESESDEKIPAKSVHDVTGKATKMSIFRTKFALF